MPFYGPTIERGDWRIATDSDIHGHGWKACYWSEAPEHTDTPVCWTGLYAEREQAIAVAEHMIRLATRPTPPAERRAAWLRSQQRLRATATALGMRVFGGEE